MTRTCAMTGAAGRRARPLVLLGAILAVAGAAPASAAPVTAVAGFDHYAGPAGQTTNGVLGAVVVGAGGGDVTLAATRFDDSQAGAGASVTGALGLPLAPLVTLRIAGTHFTGEQDLTAWRARVGPQFSLPRGATLSLAYAHFRNHLGARSNAGLAEAAAPLVPRLHGRASASLASVPQAGPVVTGGLGLGWSIVRNLELAGEAGVLSSEGGAGSPASGGGGPLGGLPLLGAGGSGAPTPAPRETHGTFTLGVRLTLP